MFRLEVLLLGACSLFGAILTLGNFLGGADGWGVVCLSITMGACFFTGRYAESNYQDLEICVHHIPSDTQDGE